MDLPSRPEPLTARHTIPRPSGWLIAATFASLLLLLVQIMRWPLVDKLSVFVEPFLEMIVFAILFIVAVGSLIQALRRSRRTNLQSWIPFAICMATTAIVVLTPFDAIYLNANFRLMQARRTAVANEVIAGRTGPVSNHSVSCGDFIQLSNPDHHLSEGGMIVVDHKDGKPLVLFLTFRGILERFSGYVYSPSGEPPAKTQFCGDGREIWQVAPRWFWYAS